MNRIASVNKTRFLTINVGDIMSQVSIKKTIIGLTTGLLVSTSLSFGALAQTVSPVQLLKAKIDQPASTSSPEAVRSLQAVFENMKRGDAKWRSIEATSEGLAFSKFQLDSGGSDMKAQSAVLKGISESGGVYTAQWVEISDFVVKGDDKSVTEGDIMRYGPVTFGGGGVSAMSNVMSGDVIPENMVVKNVTYEDKTDVFQTDLMAWGPSSTGSGSIMALENLRGTSEDPDMKDPIEMSIGEMFMDGFSVKGMSIAEFANAGTGFATLDSEEFEFRKMGMSDMNFDVEGLIMDVAGIDINRNEVGGIETTRIKMLPARFNGSRVKDDDIKGLFEMMEVNEFVLQGNAETIFNKGAKTIRMRNTNIEMIDWFNFDLEYDMSNVDDAALMTAFASDDVNENFNYTFDRARITFADKSGIDKMLAIYAKQQGMSPAAARMQATAMVSLLSMSADSSDPVTSQLMRDFSSAAGKMLKSGGAMTMTMDPEPGISSQDIDVISENGDAESLKRLGMSISYSPVQ